jgi:hypothetical protein
MLCLEDRAALNTFPFTVKKVGHFFLWWGVQCSWAGRSRVRSVCNRLVMALLLCNLGYPLHAVFVRPCCIEYIPFCCRKGRPCCIEYISSCEKKGIQEIPPSRAQSQLLSLLVRPAAIAISQPRSRSPGRSLRAPPLAFLYRNFLHRVKPSFLVARENFQRSRLGVSKTPTEQHAERVYVTDGSQ